MTNWQFPFLSLPSYNSLRANLSTSQKSNFASSVDVQRIGDLSLVERRSNADDDRPLNFILIANQSDLYEFISAWIDIKTHRILFADKEKGNGAGRGEKMILRGILWYFAAISFKRWWHNYKPLCECC